MFTEEQELEMFKWEKLEDILSSKTIDVLTDYRDIVSSAFLSETLIDDLITHTISSGKLELVAQNMDTMVLYRNWDLAQKNPEYKDILFKNFSKALENPATVDGYTLKLIAEENPALVPANWEALTQKSADMYISRKDVIEILKSTEDGNQIVNGNFSTFFKGNFQYGPFMEELLSQNLATKEQIAEEILADPESIVKTSLTANGSGYDFKQLLEVTDQILSTTPGLDPEKVKNARTAMEDIMLENFDTVLEKATVQEFDENYEVKGEHYSMENLAKLKSFFQDKSKINAKLAQNHDTIISKLDPAETMDYIHLFADTGVQMRDYSIEEIMSNTFSHIKDPDLQWSIARMASELLEDQNLTPEQMQIYGSGQFSKTIKIGEYIFKVGKERNTSTILNDERIAQPLIRRELDGEEDEKIFVEVQDLVDKEWFKGLTQEEIDEELYKMYSEMRDRGIRWTDVKEDNVGRLLKPNSGEFKINGQDLKGADTARSFISRDNKEETVLGVGELVIIDTDFIYDANQENIHGANYSRHRDFEKRYLKEKAEREKAAEEQKKAEPEAERPKLLTSAISNSKEQLTSRDIATAGNALVNLINQKTEARENSQNQVARRDADIQTRQ